MEQKIVVQQKPQKSPGLAGILSAIFPFGVGALYNGQRNKALVHLFVLFGLIYAITRGGSGLLFGLLIAGFYFYQIFDNIQSAKAINAASTGQQSAAEAVQELPEVISSGSIFWGALLIVLGVVLILANLEIVPYRTLGNYWPIAVIVIGLKLVADAVAKSKNNK
jgi:TM2 domain-containing membrane protein YozV